MNAKLLNDVRGVGNHVVKACHNMARVMTPQEWQTWFCGAVIANVVGNLPDEYWKEAKVKVPCGRAGCDCHLQFADLWFSWIGCERTISSILREALLNE